MKLLLDLPVGDGEHCGACPLADGVCICPLFDATICDPKESDDSIRCADCLAAEMSHKRLSGVGWAGVPKLTGLSEEELDELVKARALELTQDIVRLAFERSKEGIE